MPYIDQKRRQEMNEPPLPPGTVFNLGPGAVVPVVASPEPQTVGELNYRLTRMVRVARWDRDERLAIQLVAECGKYINLKGESYQTFNDVMGVLACAAAEHRRRDWHGAEKLDAAASILYRGRVAPYEELKIAENGDITDEG